MSVALEDDPSVWSKSDADCAHCGERLHYTEEILYLNVGTGVSGDGNQFFIAEYYDLEGDYYYEPQFMHLECWESVLEELHEMVEEAPPVEAEGEILKCRGCDGSICELEYFMFAYVGELQVSSRKPNGDVSQIFWNNSSPYCICLSCLLLIQEHVLDMWEDVNQFGECEDCTHARCWRLGENGCDCSCHDSMNEESPT